MVKGKKMKELRPIKLCGPNEILTFLDSKFPMVEKIFPAMGSRKNQNNQLRPICYPISVVESLEFQIPFSHVRILTYHI